MWGRNAAGRAPGPPGRGIPPTPHQPPRENEGPSPRDPRAAMAERASASVRAPFHSLQQRWDAARFGQSRAQAVADG